MEIDKLIGRQIYVCTLELIRGGDRSHADSRWKKWDKRRDFDNGKYRDGTYDVNGRRLRD
jgi:hypothetical protein